MKKIYVADMSLRSSCIMGKELTFREKLNVAASLDQSGVDAIELPALQGDKESDVIYKTVASSVKNSKVCIQVGIDVEAVEAAANCLKEAVKPCLQIVVPVSTVQMEYIYHVKSAKMLEKLVAICTKAKEYFNDIEFVAQDATRADLDFLIECINTVAKNGVNAVTLCDDNGAYFPDDFARVVSKIKESCDVKLYVQPSDQLKLAAACAVSAIQSGADGVKTAEFGEFLKIDTLADIFRAKQDELGVTVALDVTKIHKTVDSMNNHREIENEGEGGLYKEASYDSACTLSDLIVAVKELGYELSEDDNGKVYEEFKRVAAKKSVIDSRELEAIVASVAMQVPSTYHLVNYVVNSGNIITATANVTLEKGDEKISGVSTGDGPIDAAFHAIEQIIGHHYELDDFQVQAVTKGREAVGSSLIRLRAGGKLYSGNGISTDIVGACIRAYINAVNKIVYEEN